MRSSPLHLCPSLHTCTHAHARTQTQFPLLLSTLSIDSFSINYLFHQMNYLTQFRAGRPPHFISLHLFPWMEKVKILYDQVTGCQWNTLKTAVTDICITEIINKNRSVAVQRVEDLEEASQANSQKQLMSHWPSRRHWYQYKDFCRWVRPKYYNFDYSSTIPAHVQ